MQWVVRSSTRVLVFTKGKVVLKFYTSKQCTILKICKLKRKRWHCVRVGRASSDRHWSYILDHWCITLFQVHPAICDTALFSKFLCPFRNRETKLLNAIFKMRVNKHQICLELSALRSSLRVAFQHIKDPVCSCCRMFTLTRPWEVLANGDSKI